MNKPDVRRSNPAVQAEIAKRLLPDVVEWLGEDHDGDEAKVIKDLSECLDYCDGYEIARCLDRVGWSPDARLVEILDSALAYCHDVKEAMITEWVKASGVKPALAVGQAVKLPGSLFVRAKKSAAEIEGIIAKASDETYEYTVCVPAFGDKKPGETGQGCYGSILPCDEVEKAVIP